MCEVTGLSKGRVRITRALFITFITWSKIPHTFSEGIMFSKLRGEEELFHSVN
jgi:hypothetical protein